MDRSRGEEAPRYYEKLGLAAGLRLLLWTCTAVLVLAGLVLAVTSPRRSGAEAVAGVLLTLGGFAVVASWRAGTYEAVVTRTTLRTGFGPFARVYPVWSVHSAAIRDATGWHRYYAVHELVVELEEGKGRRTLVVPTAEPEEMASVLKRE